MTQAGADSCKGDSGGPLVCNIENKLTFVGIVSLGHMCNAAGYPGIYANVLSFHAWLADSKLCINKETVISCVLKFFRGSNFS